MSREGLNFGDFELDPPAYQLRREGKPVKLERIPMDLLLLLVNRRGELVTRAEIIETLWGKGVFLEGDTAINTAVGKLRYALRDSPNKPKYVQTVTGKGYRFIAPVAPAAQLAMHSPPHGAADLAGASREIVLAVLPFDDLSGLSERDYFVDGLTEEMILALGRVNSQRLRVIARTSSMLYRQTTKPISQIARELGVQYLVEGSVRREGERLRIVAKLISAANQSQVWSASYDRNAENFLGVQQELAAAICGQIQGRLPRTISAQSTRSTQSAPAYDHYLRGRHFWNHLTPPNLRRAIEFFQAAVNDDPDYALAYAGMADAYAYLPLTSDVPPLDYWTKAKAAAERAAQLDPASSEALTSRGIVCFWLDWEWAAAEDALRRALQLDANNTMAHRLLAHVLSQTSRHDQAVTQMQTGRRLDPFSPVMQAISAQFLFQARRYPEARERAQAALTLDESFWVAHVMLAQPLEQLGAHDDAIRECERAFKLSEGNTLPLSIKGYILATAGRRAEALELLRLMEESALHRYVPAYNIALVYAGLGDEAAVYRCLDRALDERNVHMVFLTADPKWDAYRSSRNFVSLLRRAGIAPEHLSHAHEH